MEILDLIQEENKLSLLIMPSNVLPLHLKQTFPSIIRIFTEGEGDGIGTMLPFKIFSTLRQRKHPHFTTLSILFLIFILIVQALKSKT